jgi:hypothetical protein
VAEHDEIDVERFSHGHEGAPDGLSYRVPVDGKPVKFKTATPTGVEVLTAVHKRPCGFELIELNVHHENLVIEPAQRVNLRKKGLKGFITAHREIVTVYFGVPPGRPHAIERGDRTVKEILALVGLSPEGYMLLEEKDGPPVPLPEDKPVHIVGCEVFHTQVKSGGSSSPESDQ